MEKDARKARLIRGLQELRAVMDGSRRQIFFQADVQAATAKAQKLGVIAQMQVICQGSGLRRRVGNAKIKTVFN